jgi:hypothetical protein
MNMKQVSRHNEKLRGILLPEQMVNWSGQCPTRIKLAWVESYAAGWLTDKTHASMRQHAESCI